MIRLFTIVFLVVCIHFNQYSVESTVFLCNATASCGCSRFAADINVRMVGDEIAINHSWGWIVSLRDHLGNSICGGSILSQSYVLTAAHCVYHKVLTPDSLTIIVGANTLNSNDGQNISLKKIFIHPAYDQFSKENDIAVLYLRKPIDFTDVNLAKMCLPAVPKAEQSQYPIVNKPVVAIGWGTTSSSGPISNFLRQVTVKTIESYDRRCRSSLGNTNIQFCATVNGGGKDTCQGDSGGPIMYYSENEQVWVLAGITSYGRGCGLPDYAGVYTRVSVYIEWIQSIVDDDGIVTIPQNKAYIYSTSNLIVLILSFFLIVIYIYRSKI